MSSDKGTAQAMAVAMPMASAYLVDALYLHLVHRLVLLEGFRFAENAQLHNCKAMLAFRLNSPGTRTLTSTHHNQRCSNASVDARARTRRHLWSGHKTPAPRPERAPINSNVWLTPWRRYSCANPIPICRPVNSVSGRREAEEKCDCILLR